MAESTVTADSKLTSSDTRRRIWAIVGASSGNLVEWFDFYVYSFCSLYFAHIFGTVAKLAMRQPFVLFKGLTFQKLCLPGAFRPG
ncbi:hypothetical protein ACRWF9_24295, partial [Escherichia coli]